MKHNKAPTGSLLIDFLNLIVTGVIFLIIILVAFSLVIFMKEVAFGNTTLSEFIKNYSKQIQTAISAVSEWSKNFVFKLSH